MAKQQAAKLENLFESVEKKGRKELNIVLKADVQGSVEAIMDSLNKLSTDEVNVRFVAYGVGAITESDVNLAVASAAVVVGFNVRAGYSAKQLAQKETVDLRYYSIIYDLINRLNRLCLVCYRLKYKRKLLVWPEFKTCLDLLK